MHPCRGTAPSGGKGHLQNAEPHSQQVRGPGLSKQYLYGKRVLYGVWRCCRSKGRERRAEERGAVLEAPRTWPRFLTSCFCSEPGCGCPSRPRSSRLTASEPACPRRSPGLRKGQPGPMPCSALVAGQSSTPGTKWLPEEGALGQGGWDQVHGDHSWVAHGSWETSGA